MDLFIVPVPIGNLKDITLRAIDTLRDVDFIIAEDTRYSLKLLNHLGIRKKIYSFYQPKEKEKTDFLLKKILNHQSAALITNSGTPAISDPGYILIREAIYRGISIIALPGPTAFVPALISSGIAPSRFLFLGFPPRKKQELSAFLKKLSQLEFTLVFYESPRRVKTFLETAFTYMGNKSFSIVKELSKKNEKIIRGNLDDLDKILISETLLGEMVIIIEGQTRKYSKPAEVKLDTMEDLFVYFKETHNISKNQLKKVLMKKD